MRGTIQDVVKKCIPIPVPFLSGRLQPVRYGILIPHPVSAIFRNGNGITERLTVDRVSPDHKRIGTERKDVALRNRFPGYE